MVSTASLVGSVELTHDLLANLQVMAEVAPDDGGADQTLSLLDLERGHRHPNPAPLLEDAAALGHDDDQDLVGGDLDALQRPDPIPGDPGRHHHRREDR